MRRSIVSWPWGWTPWGPRCPGRTSRVGRMPRKKHERFLVETSAVRPALGDSTPRHCAHFRGEVTGGDLITSVYVRMEFLRRWVCDAIRLALLIDRCGSVAEALCLVEQDFRPRSVKGLLAVI